MSPQDQGPQGRATLSITGPVAELVFTNPDDGLMDAAMEAELLAAVQTMVTTPDLRVCVLRGGQPGVFVRHYDLKVLAPKAAAMAERGLEFSTDRPVPEGAIHKAMALMVASDVIFIAALNGTAMGGGFELALACDLRVVEAGDYIFGLPEINLGILPGAGGTQRLPHLIGQTRALHMMLTGKTLTPQEMLETGLAHSLVQDAHEEALSLAEILAAKPARAMGHIKRLVRQESADGHADERTLFCDLMVQPDAMRLLAEGAAGTRKITDEP